MVIRKSKENVPRYLPPAKLFLDDIEEIVSLFKNLGKPSDSSSDAPKTEGDPTVKITVKDMECDTIDDLKELGGSNTEFSIDVDAGNGCSGYIQGAPHFCIWGVSGISDADEWSMYGQIHHIFKRRLVKWKDTLNQIGFGYHILAFLGVFFSLVALTPSRSMREEFGISVDWRITGPLLLLLVGNMVAFLFTAIGVTERTKVIFRYSFERKISSKKLADLIPYLIGTAIGTIITVIAQRLLSWLWP